MTVIFILMWILGIATVMGAAWLIREKINNGFEWLPAEDYNPSCTEEEFEEAMQLLVETEGWRDDHVYIHGVDPITSEKPSVASIPAESTALYKEGDKVVMKKPVNNSHFFEKDDVVIIDVVRHFDNSYYAECNDGIGQFINENQIKGYAKV